MFVTLEHMSIAQLEAVACPAWSNGVPSVAGDPGLPPPAVAERGLEQIAAGKPATWCIPFLSVISAPDRVIAGSCGFKGTPHCGEVEIGYGVSPTFRNQGIATAALREMLKIAFADESVTQVLATINPANDASIHVAQKSGFRKGEAFVDATGEDLVRWLCRRADFPVP